MKELSDMNNILCFSLVFISIIFLYLSAVLIGIRRNRRIHRVFVDQSDPHNVHEFDLIIPQASVTKDGLKHVNQYVDRVVNNTNNNTSVYICALDNKRGLLVRKNNSIVTIHFSFDRKAANHSEAQIRQLFLDRNLVPIEDHLMDMPPTVLLLAYDVSSNPDEVSDICIAALHNGWGIAYTDRLRFIFMS